MDFIQVKPLNASLFNLFEVEEMDKFIKTTSKEEDVSLRYLFEFEPLSTSGGLFHFRDQIQKNLKEDGTIFFMNCDVCSLFPLEKLEKVIIPKTTIKKIKF